MRAVPYIDRSLHTVGRVNYAWWLEGSGGYCLDAPELLPAGYSFAGAPWHGKNHVGQSCVDRNFNYAQW